jgi:hypothetical protein
VPIGTLSRLTVMSTAAVFVGTRVTVQATASTKDHGSLRVTHLRRIPNVPPARATVTARGLLMPLKVARLGFPSVHAVSVQQRERPR